MSKSQVIRLPNLQVASQAVQTVSVGVTVEAARVHPQRLGNRHIGTPPVEQFRHGYVPRLAPADMLRLL